MDHPCQLSSWGQKRYKPRVLYQENLFIDTPRRGTFEITGRLQQIVAKSAIHEGLCNVFVHHTSASLLINENADPDVQRDLNAFFARLVPDGDALYRHTAEGPDDMPAHVRTALTQSSLAIPVKDKRCDLGTWQGVYLWEHRHAAHRRRLTITIMGNFREKAPKP